MESKTVLKSYMKAFAQNLRRLRQTKYETMNDIVKNSQFDKSNYARYEVGKGNPTIETILRIASVLEVEPKELFDFDFDIKTHRIDDAHTKNKQ